MDSNLSLFRPGTWSDLLSVCVGWIDIISCVLHLCSTSCYRRGGFRFKKRTISCSCLHLFKSHHQHVWCLIAATFPNNRLEKQLSAIENTLESHFNEEAARENMQKHNYGGGQRIGAFRLVAPSCKCTTQSTKIQSRDGVKWKALTFIFKLDKVFFRRCRLFFLSSFSRSTQISTPCYFMSHDEKKKLQIRREQKKIDAFRIANIERIKKDCVVKRQRKILKSPPARLYNLFFHHVAHE